MDRFIVNIIHRPEMVPEYAEKVTGKQKQRLTFFLQKSKKLLEHYEYNDQRECVSVMRSFVRFYEFLLQVSSFEDTDLHKKYNFIVWLLPYLKSWASLTKHTYTLLTERRQRQGRGQ